MNLTRAIKEIEEYQSKPQSSIIISVRKGDLEIPVKTLLSDGWGVVFQSLDNDFNRDVRNLFDVLTKPSDKEQR